VTATIPSTALVTIQPVSTESERLALAGFLAGYRGLTREVYTLDLHQFSGWCQARSLPLFLVRRADIETFALELEAKGRARATVTRRLCTIAGFYKYAVEEELLEHFPAAHVRRRGWTTSRTPRHRTVMNLARSWSPPGSAARRAPAARSTWR
jgi:integrase/recombinase XerD